MSLLRKYVASFAALCSCIVASHSAYTQENDPLIVYSGRGEGLVGDLFTQFTQTTGIPVDIRYNSTSSLATLVLVEGKESLADVVFFQESGYLSVLGEHGMLRTIPNTLLQQVPDTLRDPQQHWIGTSARMRVLAYNTDKVRIEDLPTSLSEITNEQWHGKVAWSPSNASMHANVSALRHTWGEEQTKQWLEDFKNNKPLAYASNAQQVRAIGDGEAFIGWTNHYYAHRLKAQDPSLAVANYHFPDSGSEGNLLIVSGIGIMKHSNKQQQAEALIAFLLSEPAQQYFTEQGFEYPTTQHTTPNKDLTPLSELSLMQISHTDLADVAPTLLLLQQLNIN